MGGSNTSSCTDSPSPRDVLSELSCGASRGSASESDSTKLTRNGIITSVAEVNLAMVNTSINKL